jgi:hypothetical protein
LNGRDRGAILGALEQLRLRLLDLSGRNRLLNFRDTAGRSLQFVEGQPSAIYQKLFEGANRPSINILGLPEPPRKTGSSATGGCHGPSQESGPRGKAFPRVMTCRIIREIYQPRTSVLCCIWTI